MFRVALTVLIVGILFGFGCTKATQLEQVERTPKRWQSELASKAKSKPRFEPNFYLSWPPSDVDRSNESNALLQGKLDLAPFMEDKASGLNVSMTLFRPTNETARDRWNESLAFPQYDWMSKVRVWDTHQTWLWPNLAFLLTAHGQERIERYGGIDPDKGVDNDYAGIFIKELSSENNSEFAVSAQWQPDRDNTNRNTICHFAKSSEFRVLIPAKAKASGTFGIWLIYADFLGVAPPRSWPSEKEDAGGILAYFQVHWRVDSESIENEDQLKFDFQQLRPPSSTKFDWRQWSTGEVPFESKLTLQLNP